MDPTVIQKVALYTSHPILFHISIVHITYTPINSFSCVLEQAHFVSYSIGTTEGPRMTLPCAASDLLNRYFDTFGMNSGAASGFVQMSATLSLVSTFPKEMIFHLSCNSFPNSMVVAC